MVSILEAVALVLEETKRIFINYDTKIHFRQANLVDWPSISLARAADCGSIG